jgi:hypothetical protein
MEGDVKGKFCAECGWPDFCRTDCRRTTAHDRYRQRQAWVATVMLQTAGNEEQRGYWKRQLNWAEKAQEMAA